MAVPLPRPNRPDGKHAAPRNGPVQLCYVRKDGRQDAGKTTSQSFIKPHWKDLEGRRKKKKAHTNMSAHSFLFVLTQSFANNGTCEATKRNSGSFRETLAGTEVNTRWQMRIPLFRLTTQ